MKSSVIGFYSRRPGVGRSQAAANVGLLLAASGQRVVLVDWDFEKPSLHQYLEPHLSVEKLAETPGAIDYAWDAVVLARRRQSDARATESGDKPVDGAGYEVARLAVESMGWGELALLPAGRSGRQYLPRVLYFNWQEFFDRYDGYTVLQRLLAGLQKAYDFILIDVCAGPPSSSSAAALSWANALVPCFTLDTDDIKTTAESVRALAASSENRLESVFPVPMRVELAEKQLLDHARQVARQQFRDAASGLLPADFDQFLAKIEVPYTPYYSYQRTLAVLIDDLTQANSLSAAYLRLASTLAGRQIQPQLAPRLVEAARARHSAAPISNNHEYQRHFTKPEPYQGQRPFVFASYAHNDVDRVIPIIGDLIELGFRVWWDQDLVAGKPWSQELSRRITSAGTLVLFLSVSAAASSVVLEEVQHATKCGVPIVPIRLDYALLSSPLEEATGGLHYLGLNEPDFAPRLARALRDCGCADE